MGPHNRYWGDLVMASVMAGGGMIFPTAAARVVGKDWPKPSSLHNDMTLEFEEDETVNAHPCKKIIVCKNEKPGQLIFWIDAELGVVRKWESESDQRYMSACYELIRINPKLNASEFKIPEKAIRKANEEIRERGLE